MENSAFWKLIDASRLAADGDPEAQLDRLGELLAELDPAEISAFDGIFVEHHNRAYTWDLWAAAYIIGGGCSDDGFMDFRGWLISKGEKVFNDALRDAETLADVVTEVDGECQVEGYQYAARQAWEDKTGRPGEEFPEHLFEYPDGPQGDSWEEEELDARFPKLSKKFNVDE